MSLSYRQKQFIKKIEEEGEYEISWHYPADTDFTEVAEWARENGAAVTEFRNSVTGEIKCEIELPKAWTNEEIDQFDEKMRKRFKGRKPRKRKAAADG